MKALVATALLVAAWSGGVVAAEAAATSCPGSSAFPGSSAERVSVQVDRRHLEVGLGDRFGFASTVRNESGRSTTGLVAHLNILSTDPGTYVDPEDWSTQRTQFVPPLGPQASTTLRWPMQAVNTGPLLVYVAVVDPASRKVTVSQAVQVDVRRRRTIDAGGIVPLAVGVPGAVAVALVVQRLRRRRE